ncbi:MAG: Crp/Fnr family transcriptional regulator [Bacteroidales bacterium]|nr:Crp/Fnr family transcriptional regulator [Bacteroidales bacterium]NLK81568.1 Crp/Fnr family transcriptional regulator [Bacteroidales bacterium]
MPKVSLSQVLNESTLFSLLTKEQKQKILNNSTHLRYKKGETICKQGAFANHIIVITEGLAKTYLEGSNDKNLIINILKPVSWIGLSSTYNEITYNFTAATIIDSSICFIEKTVFTDILLENNEFSNDIIGRLCNDSKHFFNKITSLGNKQLHGRFADALLYLSKNVAKSPSIDLSITRKEIGDLAGISTESAIRLLSELNHDGIIKLEGKKITILKENLLEKLSKIG